MYKVLIVDDEKIIRIALQSMISWEKEGFCANYTAEDGIEALEMVRLHKPHLIIVDIMMPKMNGIDFVKTVRANGFAGEIIILSNHQDFKYAVEALRNRVSDYLMKTDISPSSLTRCIAKIKAQLEKTFPPLPDTVKASDAEKDRCTLLESLNSGKKCAESALSKPYIFLNVFLRPKLTENTENSAMPENALKNLVMEHLKNPDYFLLQPEANSVLAVIPQQTLNESSVETFSRLTTELSRLIHLYMNTPCGFILSKTFQSSEQFLEDFGDLPKVKRLLLYYGFGTLIPQAEAALYTNAPLEASLCIRNLKNFMDQNDYSGWMQAFKNILSVLKAKKVNPMSATALIRNLFEYTFLHHTLLTSSAPTETETIRHQLALNCTLEDYVSSYEQLVDLIVSRTPNLSGPLWRTEIVKINNYIEQNIYKKITLSMIAENVNMSENYISRLFKSETGINIIQYINLLKMNRAKDLLETPHIPIQTIALSLGFEETSYFNKLFYKFYGINPTKYRKMYLELLK